MNILFRLKPYNFKFISETPNYISYPRKIDSQNSTITIKLMQPKNVSEKGFATEKNFQKLLASKKLQFIHFGIVAREHDEFEKKYNVHVKYDGCVITPFLSEQATLNNKLIANYLTKTFGDSWKKDLGFLPFGLENN